MKRFLCSLLSILFVVGIWFSVPMTASAKGNDIKCVGIYESGVIINPLYEGVVDVPEKNIYKMDTYNSDGLSDFDSSLYSDDKEVSAEVIRNGMENREAEIEFYYKSATEISSESALNELFSQILELAFKETDKPTQGDTLRLGLWYYSPSVTVYTDNTTYYYEYSVGFGYYTTKAEEDELTAAVGNLIDEFGFTEETTEREKSDAIYDYITQNITYDYDGLKAEDTDNYEYTPYAALINKTAVCQGYAMLYYRLAEEVGLDSRVVTGKSFGENHAWNIVRMADVYDVSAYYFLDSTWDAGKEYYDYYLKGAFDFYDHDGLDWFALPENKKYSIWQYGPFIPDFEATSGDYEYLVKDDVAYITKYNGTEEDVVVPNRLDKYPVHYIQGRAFSGNDNIKTLTISEGILSAEEAFVNACNNLKTLKLPSSIDLVVSNYGKFISTGFSKIPLYCTGLENIELAENNPYMTMVDGVLYSKDMKTLVMCPAASAITSIQIPDGVVEIGPSALADCKNITTIELPDSLKRINMLALESTSISEITLPDGFEHIDQYAFTNSKVKSLHIPASVTYIGAPILGGCEIESITVDENNERFYIENDALCGRFSDGIVFYNCFSTAEKYMVPQDVTIIAQNAFDSNKMKMVVLHSNITKINSNSFERYENLEHIELPASISEIDDYMFSDCINLVSVIIPDSIKEFGRNVFGNANVTVYYESENSKAYTYAENNQLNYKPVSEFICSTGHNMEYVCDSDGYRYTCSVCGGSSKNNPLKAIWTAKGTLVKDEFIFGDINPVVDKIVYGDTVLVENEDYVVLDDYGDFPGTQYLSVRGINEFSGILQIPFTIHKADISKKEVELSFYECEYSGSWLVPVVTIDGLSRGSDYELSFTNNINVGTATVTITGVNTHYGTITKTFNITPKDFSKIGVDVSVETGWYEYDGTEKCPNVSFGGLTEGVDYTVSYKNNVNVGTATVVLTAMGNFSGSVSSTFFIGQKYITEQDVTLEYEKVVYDGKEKCPKVTIKGLEEGVDYTVVYKNNINVGYAYAEIILKNDNYDIDGVARCPEFQITRPAHTHNYKNTNTVQPTCTGTGTKTFTCSCGDSYTETIAAKGHTEVTVTGKAATCTQSGLTDGKKCSVCNTVTKAQETIKAAGHKEVVIPAVAPTYTTVGKTEGKKCSVCGTITVAQKDVAKLTLATPVVTVKNSATGVKVTWNAIDGATSYKVYRKTYSTKTKKYGSWKTCGTVTATSYVDTNAKSGTKYIYTVKAFNGDTKSGIKNSSSILFLAQPTVKIANASTGVKVTWNKITGATGYKVYRAEYKNGKWSSWKGMKTIDKGSTVSYTDKSAKSGVKYKYTVKAVNGKTASTYKSSSSLLYLAQPKVAVKALSNGIKVAWVQSAGATSYKIYRSEYNAKTKKWSSWKTIKTAKSTSKSYVDKSAKKGVKYRYTVKAVNGKVASTYKASSSVKR